MKKVAKTKIAKLLKKALFFAPTIFIATFLEMYWSMGEFSERVSASCFECSFFTDLFFCSWVTASFLTILFLVTSMSKNKALKIIIEMVLLSFAWLFCNYFILGDRYTGWSTFSFSEEISYMLSLSFFPVAILSSVLVLLFNKQKTNEKRAFLE